MVREERLELPMARLRDAFTARLLHPICISTHDGADGEIRTRTTQLLELSTLPSWSTSA